MRALIIGVSGQDGAYLAELLLAKGYEVHGTSRDATHGFPGLARLGIRERVRCLSMAPTDFRSVLTTLVRVEPEEVYNLSGQTSVGLSFEQPVETTESIGLATLNLLEVIRFLRRPIRFYSAGSGEAFGDTHGVPADEETPFRPRSPYATAKAAAHFQVANYREAYGLHASSGILFNHESPLRPERFVTRKIVQGAVRLALRGGEKLRLGNIEVQRDWGWAPEYVDAMWRMLQQPAGGDYVIGTGRAWSLEAFIDTAFAEVGLDWREHVEADPALRRPTDLTANVADPAKAARVLGWRAQTDAPEVVRRMVRAERELWERQGIGGGAT